MASVIGANTHGLYLMHNRPLAEAGQGDVLTAIKDFLAESIARVQAAGVREDAILLDPGLGFGKTYDENWEIMRRLPELNELGYPLLLGASRKSMIKLLQTPKHALEQPHGPTALAIQAGVDFIRVHDVKGKIVSARRCWIVPAAGAPQTSAAV